ncbi:phosphorylase [Sphingomonas sp. NFR15]|uniref:phosphorylase family protein n=1 Tax=Sphingomonas sp. NFR15 TaxID=1566282 RepID=UPI0008906CEF|nr:phosphorylase [Sphingomonas sp. NFR15]SDA15261.1 hopanoid-associated phosphorylase [Sphingomonas sp. NFR15]
MTLLVACGLTREARIFARDDVVAVAGGGDAARLEGGLEAAVARGGVRAILSGGIAGALDPSLKPGDVVIGILFSRESGSPEQPNEAFAALDSRFRGRTAEMFPKARFGHIVGSDTIVATLASKRALYEATGALAVDMESHIAARVAARHALPFATLRTISDAANHVLPPAALVGMKPDGGMALGAVLASLARQPSQLPALIRTGRDAARAFRALERAWTSFEI